MQGFPGNTSLQNQGTDMLGLSHHFEKEQFLRQLTHDTDSTKLLCLKKIHTILLE